MAFIEASKTGSVADTDAEVAAIKEFGPCPIHRRSFISKFI